VQIFFHAVETSIADIDSVQETLDTPIFSKLNNYLKKKRTSARVKRHVLHWFLLSVSKKKYTYKQIKQHHRRDDEEVKLAHELLLSDMVDLERLWIVPLLRKLGWRDIVGAEVFGDGFVRAVAVGRDGWLGVCRIHFSDTTKELSKRGRTEAHLEGEWGGG
jgi:hypothetical protein